MRTGSVVAGIGPRMPLHWFGLAGAVIALGATAAVGLRLIDAAGRAPERIEAVLQAQNRTVTALGIVASMEADRRAYQLTRMPEHLGALQHDHDRVHDMLRGVREALARPQLAGHIEMAEAAIGSWRDEVAGPEDRPTGGGVAGDRALLGTARTHLGHVAAAVDSELLAARQGVAAARANARGLWLVVVAASLLTIVVLAQVAHGRRRRLRRSAREMGRLLDAVPFAVIALDERGRVRHASGMATELFGAAGALVNERLVERVAPMDRPLVEQGLTRAAAGGDATCEAQVRTEFDAARVLSFAFAPIVERGRQVGVSAVVRDATNERAIRMQGRETERLARVGTMAAGVAHEINGALTAIIGATALVDDGVLDPSSRSALTTAQAEARRAARTVRIILDFSRRDAHRHEPLHIRDVLERALTLRRYDPRSHDVEFRFDVPAGLPMVLGDAQELLQVFLNLLVNAEQAVRGQPLRRITVTARGEDRRVLISVADTGPGIPEDHLESVFAPFYTTKPRGDGAGLGLALARGVVVEHQGTIRAEPMPQGGARFVVALPAMPESTPGAVPTVPRPEHAPDGIGHVLVSDVNPVAVTLPLHGVMI